MKRNRIISILLTFILSAALFIMPARAKAVDYRELYLNFAEDAEFNSENPLNGILSGLSLIDLNDDFIPELLAFTTSVRYFDENGNVTYDDDYSYAEHTHSLEKVFTIRNGLVVEDSPWADERNWIPMFYLPGDSFGMETENFTTTVRDADGNTYLVMKYVYDSSCKFSSIRYGEDGIEYSQTKYDEEFGNIYENINLPAVSEYFSDNVSQTRRSRWETMKIVLDKYDGVTKKVSKWAKNEVEKAKTIDLIPEEMLNADLTKEITRAEFAAISVKLYAAILEEELNWHGGYIIDIDGHLYEGYIRGAYIYGFTNGISGDEENGVIFSPDLNITREQLATMLTRVHKAYVYEDIMFVTGEEPALDISGVEKFADDILISDYAKESVYFMSKHSITKGMDGAYFAPKNTATREQAILMALRIYENIDKMKNGAAIEADEH